MSRSNEALAIPAARPEVPAFFFAGPQRTVTAEEGDAITGTLGDPEPWLSRADRILATPGGLVVGALPFDERTPIRLFQPSSSEIGGPWAPPPGEQRGAAPFIEPEDERASLFTAAVDETSRAIREGSGLRKVVLARACDLALAERVDVRALLASLRTRSPQGYTYSLNIGGSALDPTRLVGASPELLVSRRKGIVSSVPLAGSIPRSPDPVEDRARAEGLLRSKKDLHEHELVVEHVVERLRPLTRSLRFSRTPELVSTPTMWHLATRIEGPVRDADVSSLRLAAALHPTPAVCGLPTADARAWIERLEPVDRGYFTGTLGYAEPGGDGEWIVTIRCAEISKQRARVFAGAGIVGASDPALELAETSGKMRTVLGVLAPWLGPSR